MNFTTASEAYAYIMAQVEKANNAGNARKARAWSAKATPAMLRAVRAEQTFVIATRKDA